MSHFLLTNPEDQDRRLGGLQPAWPVDLEITDIVIQENWRYYLTRPSPINGAVVHGLESSSDLAGVLDVTRPLFLPRVGN